MTKKGRKKENRRNRREEGARQKRNYSKLGKEN